MVCFSIFQIKLVLIKTFLCTFLIIYDSISTMNVIMEEVCQVFQLEIATNLMAHSKPY